MEVRQFDTRVRKGLGHTKRDLSPCVGSYSVVKGLRESYIRSTLQHFLSPLVTKPLWISKEPFVLHRSSENDRGFEKEP